MSELKGSREAFEEVTRPFFEFFERPPSDRTTQIWIYLLKRATEERPS